MKETTDAYLGEKKKLEGLLCGISRKKEGETLHTFGEHR